LYSSSAASRADDSQHTLVTAPAISSVSIPSGSTGLQVALSREERARARFDGAPIARHRLELVPNRGAASAAVPVRQVLRGEPGEPAAQRGVRTLQPCSSPIRTPACSRHTRR
jgi:hypothetical protein